MMDSREPKRLLQRDVCALVVVVALVAMCLGAAVGLGTVVISPAQQREAADAVRRAGGHAVYGPSRLVERTDWLCELLGEDFFFHVESVDFSNPSLSDDDIKGLIPYLRPLPKLKRLSIRDAAITDKGLEHLKALTQLEELDLRGTRVTGTGLEHLKNLRDLHLEGDHVTPRGVRSIGRCTGLRHLDLRGPSICDDTLVHLAGLVNLETLFLDGSAITDAGVARLASLPNLRSLQLVMGPNGETPLTDGAFQKFRRDRPGLRIGLVGRGVRERTR